MSKEIRDLQAKIEHLNFILEIKRSDRNEYFAKTSVIHDEKFHYLYLRTLDTEINETHFKIIELKTKLRELIKIYVSNCDNASLNQILNAIC